MYELKIYERLGLNDTPSSERGIQLEIRVIVTCEEIGMIKSLVTKCLQTDIRYS